MSIKITDNNDYKITIREAKKEDFKELAKIKTESYLKPILRKEKGITEKELYESYKRTTKLSNRFSKWFTILIEEDEKETIVGSFTLDFIDTYNKHGYLNYYIDNKYHRRGIGTIMVKFAKDEAQKKLKLNKLMSSIADYNEASRKLIEKSGFKLLGIMHKHVRISDRVYQNVCMYECLF